MQCERLHEKAVHLKVCILEINFTQFLSEAVREHRRFDEPTALSNVRIRI